MKIQQILELTHAVVVCGGDRLDKEISHAFASDLMSDVLTLDMSDVILITGLCNSQTIRTAEMADIPCVLFVRGKKATPEIIALAEESDIVLLETNYSMYRAGGELHAQGLQAIY
ncbi:hypothetical protein LJC35_00575 [Parabacteroides sp. OttesenSCG-928-N08]|nr:hypothetical protein [Parabacteroides sp. OttesenSCG-928-N08]